MYETPAKRVAIEMQKRGTLIASNVCDGKAIILTDVFAFSSEVDRIAPLLGYQPKYSAEQMRAMVAVIAAGSGISSS